MVIAILQLDKNELKIFATDLGSFYDSEVKGKFIFSYQTNHRKNNIEEIMIDKLMCFYVDIMYIMFTKYFIKKICKNLKFKFVRF